MKRRGITLIELMMSIVITVILTAAVTQAFVSAINYESHLTAAREKAEAHSQFEDRLINLLQHAYLGPDNTQTDTYFIGGSDDDNAIQAGNATTLQFTVQGERARGALLASTDDFETLNQTYGPQGGIAEIQLGTTAVGDAGDEQGLFVRTQRPADSEPTQGGTESLMDADIRTIEFEFWDGTAWQPTWSTQIGAEKRLPAAVRVTYTVEGEDANSPRIIVVEIPNSDVTADDPAEQTAPGGGL